MAKALETATRKIPMSFVRTKWSRDAAVDREADRITKLFQSTKAPSLATFARGRLTPPERRWLTAQGSAGTLVQTFLQYPWLLQWYANDGWPGVLAAMAHYQEPHPLAAMATALWEVALFSKFDWRIAPCKYPKGEIHWYVHQPTGRPPKACPLHRQAARVDRWRKSPARSLLKGGRRGRTSESDAQARHEWKP